MFDRRISYPRFSILRNSVHGLSLDTKIVGSWKFQWRRLPFHFCEKLNRPRFKVAIPREGRGQHEGKMEYTLSESSSRLIFRIYNRFVVVLKEYLDSPDIQINREELTTLRFPICNLWSFFRGIEDKRERKNREGNTNNCLMQFRIEWRFLKIWLKKSMNEFYLQRNLN